MANGTSTQHRARNRDIAERNAAIYNAVQVEGKPQTVVAAEFGVTQPRVSQIVNNPVSHEY